MLQFKTNDHGFIVTAEDSVKTLERVHFNKRFNAVLEFVSKKTHKNRKNHSLRINLDTALIQTVGMGAAYKAIGHSDIRIT